MGSQFLSRHKKLHYIGKCIRQFRNDAFVDEVLNAYDDPYRIKYVCKGDENPDICILMIPNLVPLNGFFAELRMTLRLLAYADRYGLVPHVLYDLQYLYAESEGVNGVYNPYEYYFVQPSGLTTDSVNHSYNLCYGTMAHARMIDRICGLTPNTYETNDVYIKKMAEIMQKYVIMNDKASCYVEKGIQGLFTHDKRVLGIHHRGTDYKMDYRYHPRYISLSDKIRHIEALADNYDNIFVATDDVEALAVLEKRFGSKLCYYSDIYRGKDNVSVAFSSDTREHHKYRLGLEVLRDMYTLSACTGLVAGVSQVSLFAQIVKSSREEIYEDIDIMDAGTNQAGKIFTTKISQ